MTIKAKFDSKCFKCGKTWKTGDDIHYQKTPYVVCIDQECYTKHGGKPYEKKPSASEEITQLKEQIFQLQTAVAKHSERLRILEEREF